MSDWRSATLGELVDVLDAQRRPVNSEERSVRIGDVPYYGANGQQGWIDEPLFDEPLILMAEDGGNFDDFHTRPIAYRIDGPSWVNNHAHIIRSKRGVYQPFLFWNLVHRDIRRYISGGTRTKLTQAEMRAIELKVPDLIKQRRIAEILDTLDDQIRTAESIAAKLMILEDGMLTYLLNTVPQDLNRRLEHLLLVPPRNGYSPVAAAGPTGEYMLGLGCLTIRGFVPRQLKNAPIDDLRLRPFLLYDGDILISRSNTRDLVGLAGVFRDVSSPCYYPDLMMRLVPSNSVSSEYLALVLNSHRVRRQIMNVASGTSGSMVKITRSTVGSLYLPIPSRPEQDRITSVVEGLRRTVDRELAQLQKLRRLKFGLSADLLTGRVRVSTEAVS